MALNVLEKAIEMIYTTADDREFSELIRAARSAIGIKSYKAAEFIGIAPARLKNLEIGYFRVMPTEIELFAISKLYGLDINLLREKAASHVEKVSAAKRIGSHD